MTDVVFAQMPFAGIERPSLALGLFSAALRGAGLTVQTVYGNIRFVERAGLPAYYMVASASPMSLLGEWIFAESTFGARAAQLEPIQNVRRFLHMNESSVDAIRRVGGHADLETLLADLRRQAGELVEELAAEIVAQAPRVLACTSMFDQHVATLALVQSVKRRDPSILTVVGGANCHGRMGRATHLSFPAVDFTVTGEFDQQAVAFFRAAVAAAGQAERVPTPAGVLGPADRQRGCPDPLPGAPILADMDSAPVPDYDDYFEQIYSSPISAYVLPSMPLETSRGCWWGAKQHCTFCGLNAEGMTFRRKSPQRAVAEIRQLTRRYGVRRWSAADNIIDMSYFQAVLPALAQDTPRHQAFYETKANLKREHVQALAEAGCGFIQPGIESLHDETLRIMRKGTTACQNVQLLRYCLEFGVVPAWSILCGFPGSDPQWVAQVARQMPALFHLPPPNGAYPIRFDRFSPYHQDPAAFGLELEPLPAYRTVYPLDDATLRDLAYFFRRAGGDSPEVLEPAREAAGMVEAWRGAFWGARRPQLVVEQADEHTVRIRDTRPCARTALHELVGLAASVLRVLDSPAPHSAVAARLQAAGVAAEPSALEEVLRDLHARHLLWRSSTQWVALPTPPPRRPLDPQADDAVGRVDIRRYFLEKARFQRSFAGVEA